MTKPPSRSELSHERIVEAAARAIRRSGYAGTGVASVMKEAGLTHGGFYAHFKSRDALLAEAVSRAGQANAGRLERKVEALAREGVSPLRVLVESYLSDEHLEALETGCVVSALLSEMPRQAPEVREASARRVLGLVERVRVALPPGADPASAALITAAMVGGLQIARAIGTGAEAKAMLKSIREGLLAQYDTTTHA
ncbi:TetR/AcrR family transcriptional regulator [Rhizobacter sp. J219]|jgi:TetR/AcrR family transcriptional repressor of nem operon|uniref:TetR/AcrR family transcriptional regulator n=1 Tax=Rhizobacter sp. J219 TaxID=2898430 RepID=UPI002150A24D|nr:TetR/AcrR family transcriptional regulator [Rhizobacter sp. J219]MCR5885062.1 TetR/AcrR family transcriptional regulator [Rhizobacter sp. J219]